MSKFKCNFCDFTAETREEVLKHSLAEHQLQLVQARIDIDAKNLLREMERKQKQRHIIQFVMKKGKEGKE